MATIKAMLRRCEGLNTDKIIFDSIDETKDVIVELNRVQLSEGHRSDGSEILPPYSPLTRELKRHNSGLAAVVSHVTLFEEGDLYRELFAEIQGENIVFGSRDPKFERLNKKYSTDRGSIGGLDDENKRIYIRESLFPVIKEKITHQTGLIFK